MKKILSLLSLTLLSSVSLSLSPHPLVLEKHRIKLSASNGGPLTLRIFNWEDYISEPEYDGDETFDTLSEFAAAYEEEHGVSVNIVYDTFSTNEDMYNIIKLNGARYDLIVPSDYMIQRMIREDMLETFDVSEEGNYLSVPNYSEYASPYLQDIYENNGWTDYAIGYMWGTFGLLHNTTIHEDISEDVLSWSVLWDEKYAKKISIKDSMREGYLVGLFKVHEDELRRLREDYLDNTISAEAYNATLNDLLNDIAPETITAVNQALSSLKQNVYGLEVDQGKTDMVTGKIALNTAWSGDAVYAIYEAAEEVDDILRYSIPEEGSNIWFDGWVMPKGANKELAQAFVNFVSEPSNAVSNMDYIGYTTFIAGEEVLEYVSDYDEVLDDEDGYEIDLQYFFGDTIESIEDAVIYIDEAYIGGQLATQFPTHEEVIRSAVMRDFGESNKLVIDMWANFKATDIQDWMIIFSVIIVLGVTTLASFNFVQKRKAARRHRALKKKWNASRSSVVE